MTIGKAAARWREGAPTQASTSLPTLLDEARAARPLVEALARDVAERSGGIVKGPARIKDQARAAQKVENECGGRPERLLDAVAIAIEYPTLGALYAGIEALRSTERATVVRLRNKFEKPGRLGYADVNANTAVSTGHICELQLHVAPMLEAKSIEQALYGVRRVLECSSDPGAASVLSALDGAASTIYGLAHQAIAEERSLTVDEHATMFALADQARSLV